VGRKLQKKRKHLVTDPYQGGFKIGGWGGGGPANQATVDQHLSMEEEKHLLTRKKKRKF